MSTRAQIMCKGSPILIYKHNDGYPESIHGILHFLQPFVDFFTKYRDNDPSYFLAQLLRHTGENQARAQQGITDIIPPHQKVTGWGLDCTIHGDIDYLYVVDLRTITVTYYTENFESVYLANKN